jgi:glycosyltransferase involved in cell wall biosynthesis
MRLTFVVQRFGVGVIGGAERLCRATATALATAGHQITVLTTTARDYLAWADHFSAGDEPDGDVLVRRFPAQPRRPDEVAGLTRRLALGDAGWDAQRRWVLEQGPVSPGLLTALANDTPRDEVVVLWTYLYATTQLSMPLVVGRSILVPTAHDEPALRFDVTRGVMRLASGFAFLTPEEQRLVDDRFRVGDRPAEIVGAGASPAERGDPERARRRFALPRRFVLYLGRLDLGKGVGELVAHHDPYRRGGGELGLVLAGPGAGDLDLPAWVTQLGIVDDQAKTDLIAASDLVALPSTNESLSLVLAEAWQAGRATLGNARSDVVAGQTARSGGGLLYADCDTYRRQVQRISGDRALSERLGSCGAAWASTQTWEAAVERWERLADRVCRATG